LQVSLWEKQAIAYEVVKAQLEKLKERQELTS
jgi:hypothetical protein